MKEFLEKLKDGGKIISSNDCSTAEWSTAEACQRSFVDDNGFGYAYIPEPKEKVKFHTN